MITKEWRLESFLLACRKFTQSHTGENISYMIDSIIREFELANSVFAWTSDNASNMIVAGRWLDDPTNTIISVAHILCFSHTNQLVVVDALDSVRTYNDLYILLPISV